MPMFDKVRQAEKCIADLPCFVGFRRLYSIHIALCL